LIQPLQHPGEAGVRLAELVRALGGRLEGLEVSAERGLGGPLLLDVELDSRRVSPGHLFAALPGEHSDGARFVREAVRAGARALLAPRSPAAPAGAAAEAGVPLWIHEDARRVVGEAAALVHGSPAKRLLTLAVTGTNGKTTVVWLAADLLEHSGAHPAVLGSVSNRVAGSLPVPARLTTPEATELQRLAARHLAGGGDTFLLEASSHALAQERLAGLGVDVAVFTNLTRDHLDYHRTMEAYADAKARLFAGLSSGSVAVLNASDPASARMAEAARAAGAEILTFGIETRASLCARVLEIRPGDCSIVLDGLGLEGREVLLPMTGRHNIENAMAAATAAIAGGLSPETVAEGLSAVRPVPGRLQRLELGAGMPEVMVDYAHTPAALERVLGVLREALENRVSRPRASRSGARGRLLCVFGCGGDRDSGKRAPMGEIAGRLADVAILTSDNPREEDPDEIQGEVLAGMCSAVAEVHIELDRRRAIQLACTLAHPEDLVLIAGKGHETVQRLAGGTEIPFDDLRIAEEVFA